MVSAVSGSERKYGRSGTMLPTTRAEGISRVRVSGSTAATWLAVNGMARTVLATASLSNGLHGTLTKPLPGSVNLYLTKIQTSTYG